MEIELIRKTLIKRGKDVSFYQIIYKANGEKLFQNSYLENEIPDDVLVHSCKIWAEAQFKKRGGK